MFKPTQAFLPSTSTGVRSALQLHNKIHSNTFVDVNAGSGLVHLSPANGEEDHNIAIKRKVTVFSPIDDAVKYGKPLVTPFELEVALGEKKWETGYQFDEIP